MKRTLVALVVALSSASAVATVAAAKREATIAIFIGPQMREGFTDVDSGIRDSIKDIQSQFRRASAFTIVGTPETADVVLFVVGRRTVGDSGSVGVPIGALTMFLPVKRRAIDTVLRVGTYEKALTSEAEDDDAWKASAKQVLKDVRAWVDANRQGLVSRSH